MQDLYSTQIDPTQETCMSQIVDGCTAPTRQRGLLLYCSVDHTDQEYIVSITLKDLDHREVGIDHTDICSR